MKQPIERYVLGQRNELGGIEYLLDNIAKTRKELEDYLYQTGYICESADGTYWKYRLKTSNQIDFYIRKLVID